MLFPGKMMDEKVIGNRQRGFVEGRLCLAALFPFWDGVTGYVDSGEKQLVGILTLPRLLTQPPKVSRSWNYALDGWLSSWMEFLQDLRVMVKGLKLNQELVASGRGWYGGQRCLMSSLTTWTMFDTPEATSGKGAQYWIPPIPEIPAHGRRSSGC